jgi:5-methylcytosine-specific restriction endonuclease McrA
MMKFEELNLLEVGHSIQLAGSVWAGPDKLHIVFLPDEKFDKPFEMMEMNTDQWQQFLRQSDLLETEILTKAADGTVAKAIVRKSQRQIDQHVSWKVFKRDRYTCCYCGRDDVPLTVDHLVLWEDCGPSIEQNMLSSCRKCNKTRGNMQYADWLQHPAYRKVSRGLSPERRAANETLLGTLATIPRVMHVKSR